MGLEAPKIRKTAAVLQGHSDLKGCGILPMVLSPSVKYSTTKLTVSLLHKNSRLGKLFVKSYCELI